MAQAAVKNSLVKNCVDVEKIILEMLPGQEAPIHIIKTEKKPLKLLKKAELNAKYLEETIPISKVDSQQYRRIYGVY